MIRTHWARILKRFFIILLPPAVLLMVGAVDCFGTDADEKPKSARVTVSGTSGATLQLVTSIDFFEQIVGDGTEIQAVLVTADTTSVTLPFEETIALNELGSVLVRLIQPDSVPTSVSMQVLLDGRLEYDRQATLSLGGSLEYRFVFVPLF